MTRIEQLELLLSEACRKLETTMTSNHPSAGPVIATMSPMLRDWYGKFRSRQCGKEPGGKECFDA